MFISRALGVVRAVSDEVLVLKDGVTVEHDRADAIFTEPRAQYTRDLLAAVPRIQRAPAREYTDQQDHDQEAAIAS